MTICITDPSFVKSRILHLFTLFFFYLALNRGDRKNTLTKYLLPCQDRSFRNLPATIGLTLAGEVREISANHETFGGSQKPTSPSLSI